MFDYTKAHTFCKKCWTHNDWFTSKCSNCGSEKLVNKVPKDEVKPKTKKKKNG